MIGCQHSCVSCPCSGDVTVKACPSTEVARTEDPEDPGLAQGLVPNLAIANERTSRLSQKPPAEMASEQGAAAYVYTCKRTSSLARYSTWSLPTTTAHSLLSMLQVALHSYMSVASALRLVHRILHQLHQISTTFRVGNSSLTHGNRAASIRSFSTTSGSSVSSNCIGPKSDGLHSKPGAKLMMMMLILSSNLQPTKSVFVDARVGAFSTTAPEAVGHASAAKHSGLRRASEPNPQLHLTRSGKRSYRRAYGRACRMGGGGGTPYKGRWRPWTWFEPRQLQPQFVGHRSIATLPTPDSWRTFTWNAGGLTTNIFQELETYAREMRYDIICVQETKWRHDSTWTNQDFHYIHSQGLGKEDRVAGLLTMISTRLVKADDIQYVAAHPGRLLHIRIPRGQSSVDIVNWYQYSVSDAEGVFDRRLSLLTKYRDVWQDYHSVIHFFWPGTSIVPSRPTRLFVAIVC